MGRLESSWAIAQAAGEAHSTIRVRNLQAIVKVGKDAWGRKDKVQPVLISVTVSLREPFETASQEDKVTTSTIHYGILSKAILGAVEDFHHNEGAQATQERRATVRDLLDHISGHLVGFPITGSVNPRSPGINSAQIINASMVRLLELKVTLPKASLIGSGVSVYGAIMFNDFGGHLDFGMGLVLHDLRVPTLIGVNSNERLAKQIVVANIELDKWTNEHDQYNELEQLVVKAIEESSFQTLEALATHVGTLVIQRFIIPAYAISTDWDSRYPRIKICLEKPTAVTLADAPAVEVLLDSRPDGQNHKWIQDLWKWPLKQPLKHESAD